MLSLSLVVGWMLVVFIGLLGASILWLIWTNKIDLKHLISEQNGDASLSRFQLLVFTFVISVSLFYIVVAATPPQFPDKIPPEILGLLGISAGSYVISKAIQKNAEMASPSTLPAPATNQPPAAPPVIIAPAAPPPAAVIVTPPVTDPVVQARGS